mgnify:CR=1 FL=1|jgi:hypothetical protein|tara:strand:+ start:94 stop:507 length:414 start_codon:yes stop_codon:yes gene_type:complete
MEKYLYFRGATAAGDDDDGENGSILFAASKLKGMVMGSMAITGIITEDDDAFSLVFEPAGIGEGDADADAGDNDVDVIQIGLKTAYDNKPQEAMKAIVEAINTHPNSDGFITIFDGVTGQSVHESIDSVVGVRAVND